MWGKVFWFLVIYDMSIDLVVLCVDYYCRGVFSYWILRVVDFSRFSLRSVVISDFRRVLRCLEMGYMVVLYC